MIRFNYAAGFAGIALLVYPDAALAKDLADVVKDMGYRIYQPPRENWGPGTVFLGSVSGNKLKVEQAICSNLFSSVAPRSTGVALQDYTSTSNTDLSFGIGLLEKIVGSNNSANLKAGYKNPRNVTVKWGNVTEQAYFAADAYKPNGQTADLNPSCRAAINNLRRQGKLKRLYVIDRAISADSLNYTFKRGDDTNPSGITGSGDLTIADIISVNASVGFTVKDQKTLVVTRPVFVGYAKPVQLAQFIPLANVSGNRVKVVVSSATSDLVIE